MGYWYDTGIFPEDTGRSISKAQKIRHASDYDEFYVASKEETENQIRTAKIVADLVDKYISQE